MVEDKVIVDLHAHTSWSDGHSSLPELVNLAKTTRLMQLAITDHDDLRALSPDNIRDNSQYLECTSQVSPGVYGYGNLDIIRGIELSCDDAGKTVHIIGLYLDEPSEQVTERFREVRNQRIERFKEMISKLNAHPAITSRGLCFDAEQILMDIVSQGIPSRLHAGVAISRGLEEMGDAVTPQQAMNTYLNRESPAYVSLTDPIFPTPKEGIEAILRLNGLAILPHLIEIETCGYNVLEKIAEYVQYGLAGFELRSGNRSAEENPTDFKWVANQLRDLKIQIPPGYNKMACLNGKSLLLTGGSDFHGAFTPERQLGIGMEGEHVKALQEAYRAITR